MNLLEISATRQIIHLDMDAFYPSVEILDNPELSGKPVIVGGKGTRGVVSSASYEARQYGVHSAQPMTKAIDLCPHAITLPVRMERYRDVSSRIFDIFRRFTPLVEPLSIDEAFLDVTGSIRLFGDPKRIASQIKKDIREETGLTVSAGVAPNKFVAKIASDMEKPDGLTVVPAEHIQAFLDPLPAGRMWGIGRVTLKTLEDMNILTFRDIRRYPADLLELKFGKNGPRMRVLAQGIDEREVIPGHSAKTLGHEETFTDDIMAMGPAKKEILALANKVGRRARRKNTTGRTITLKVKYSDFKMITRSTTLAEPTNDGLEIYSTACSLVSATEIGTRPVRLLGVSLSQLATPGTGGQLSLFQADEKRQKRRELNKAVDSLKEKHGEDSVIPGALLSD